MTLVSINKKFVLVLSTTLDTMLVDAGNEKPYHIMDYNATKGGVNTVDLMSGLCFSSKTTRRYYWYKCIQDF